MKGDGPERRRLEDMTGALLHRGPDSEGYHLDSRAALGFRRLSIVDLERGDQPLYNEDRSIAVVCNGEIYNHESLRRALLARGHGLATRSDAEVIAHLYEEEGLSFARSLRGMFALALWDSRKKRLILVRDPFGIKPLHYAVAKNRLFFASEVKSILAAKPFDPELHPPSLPRLLKFGFLPGEATLIRGVRRLPPAHILVYEKGRFEFERYWQLPVGVSSKLPEDWREELREVLRESVQAHLLSDVPLGAWLSPGLDSSGIAALMQELGHPPLHTFSVTFDDSSRDEVSSFPLLTSYPRFESIPNQRIHVPMDSLRHLPEVLWYTEEPMTFGVEIARFLLAKASSQSVKVVLTGEGADEVFGGYWWYRWSRLLRPLRPFSRLLPSSPRRGLWGARLRPLREESRSEADWFRSFVGPSSSPSLIQELLGPIGGTALIEPPSHSFWEETRGLTDFERLQQCDFGMRLPYQIVHGLDRTSMAHGLEARVPFLDRKVVEVAAKIPPSLKVRGFQEKYALREALADLLPPDLRRRKKRPLLPPFQQWLRRPLPDPLEALLQPKALEEKGYFESATVGRLRQAQREGDPAYNRLLLGILGVQIWDELYLQETAWQDLC